MKSTSTIDKIHALIDADDYLAAMSGIREARQAGCDDAILSLFEAICVYEVGEDNEALRLLAEFLGNSKNHSKQSYALFTASVCLENMGLYREAQELLSKLPKSYPGLEKEIADITRQLAQQKLALDQYAVIKSAIEPP